MRRKYLALRAFLVLLRYYLKFSFVIFLQIRLKLFLTKCLVTLVGPYLRHTSRDHLQWASRKHYETKRVNNFRVAAIV